eukprot:jgi/Botrbrau1/7337/Bobra.247_3s0032.1
MPDSNPWSRLAFLKVQKEYRTPLIVAGKQSLSRTGLLYKCNWDGFPVNSNAIQNLKSLWNIAGERWEPYFSAFAERLQRSI